MSKKQDKLAKVSNNISDSLANYTSSLRGEGGSILTAAIEKFQVDEKQAVVNKVHMLLQHIKQLRVNSEKIEIEIKLYESRIECIHSGDFKIDKNGALHFRDGFYI